MPSGLPIAGLDATPAEGLRIPSPKGLSDRDVAQWASLRAATVARAHPRASARELARLSARTPEDTTNVVLVLGRARDHAGRLWVRVRLPALEHQRGWVPRSAIGSYGTVTTRLIVDRRKLTATLWRGGEPVLSAPIGIGKAGTPTPAGRFYVRDRVTSYASATYGPLAFGTSARSDVLTDWPGGGFVGIHGTDQPELLPGRVSHGCIRMRNADIVRLGKLMPVGTPLTIV